MSGLTVPHRAAPMSQLARKDAGNTNDNPGSVELQALTKRLGDVLDATKNMGEDVKKKFEAGAQVTQELKDRVDQAITTLNETKGMAERLATLEQKAARGDISGPEHLELKSIGQLVTESEDMGGFDSSARKAVRVRMDRKALMNVTATVGTGVSTTNSLVSADRRPGLIVPPERKMTVRDLIAPGETDSNSVEYVRETGFTNAAAMVAEGGAKPYSDITYDLKTAPIRTIAHLFKASRQLLDDAPALRSYINARATYGLRLKEEAQLIGGNGVGQNILGILPQATAFNPSIILTDATGIDRLRLAILQAVLAEFPPSGFVLNPIDWVGIELTKDNEGRYIIGQPVNGIGPRLWGLPVVETQAIAQGKFLTGAFSLAAQLFDRMEIEILLSTENADDFEKNMVSIRAEERVGLAVYRPEAFVTGDVNAA